MYNKGRGREISTIESFDFYEGQSINQSVCQTVKQSLRRSTNQVINSQMKTQKVSTPTFFFSALLPSQSFLCRCFELYSSLCGSNHTTQIVDYRCDARTYSLRTTIESFFLDKFYILYVLLKLQGFISDL